MLLLSGVLQATFVAQPYRLIARYHGSALNSLKPAFLVFAACAWRPFFSTNMLLFHPAGLPLSPSPASFISSAFMFRFCISSLISCLVRVDWFTSLQDTLSRAFRTFSLPTLGSDFVWPVGKDCSPSAPWGPSFWANTVIWTRSLSSCNRPLIFFSSGRRPCLFPLVASRSCFLSMFPNTKHESSGGTAISCQHLSSDFLPVQMASFRQSPSILSRGMANLKVCSVSVSSSQSSSGSLAPAPPAD